MLTGNAAPQQQYKGDTAATQRLSEVQEQVQRSGNIMEHIEEKFKSLYTRLQPVLHPEQQSEGKSPSPKPTLVGHANALSNHNDQLDSLDQALGSILDRLEL